VFALPIPAVAATKVWVYYRSLTETAGSNTVMGMDICLLWVLCVVRYRSLQRADHSSRGVVPNVILKPRQCGGPGPLGVVAIWGLGWSLFTFVLLFKPIIHLHQWSNRPIHNILLCDLKKLHVRFRKTTMIQLRIVEVQQESLKSYSHTFGNIICGQDIDLTYV
jgi:hypothetical protein